MRIIDKTLIGFCLLLTGFASLASGQSEPCVPPPASNFQSISRAEVEMLIADVAKSNPKVIERFNEDPELKKGQLENLRELLAISLRAHRDGLATDYINCIELGSIHAEVIAAAYDKEVNKAKGPMPPFGFISEVQVKAFWSDAAKATKREADYDRFMAAKIALLKAGNPGMTDREVTEDEEVQARELFAKIQIYANEYGRKAPIMPRAFQDKAELQVKLQQAQFLARAYSDTIAEKTEVTDDEVENYIATRPELDTKAKRAKATQLLDRARKGEDFAKLADEFSDDPGTRSKGGLYSDVKKGVMIARFENAALALEPGRISPELVETDFGYHIIKLETKAASAGSYDVRHILISTQYKDPTDPAATEVPVKRYAKSKLEEEKSSKMVAEIVAASNVSVPDDFTVPAIAAKTAVKKKPAAKPGKRTVRKRT